MEHHCRPFKELDRLGYASKWLLTLSNLVALPAIFYAVYWSDSLLLLLACLYSMLHHAGEMRYYEPTILDFSPRLRWWFFRADQAGAVEAILGVGSLALLRDHETLVAIGLALMLGSEAVMFTDASDSMKIMLRTVLHLHWHALSLGPIAILAVTQYADEERLYQTLWRWLQ